MVGCNIGYVSRTGTVTAICVAADTWSPDPADLRCLEEGTQGMIMFLTNKWLRKMFKV